MLNRLKELREANEEGFTLIELLVVIVIIGILAAIALPIFLNQQKAAADATLKADIKNVSIAVQTEIVKAGSLSKVPLYGTYNYLYNGNASTFNYWPLAPGSETGGSDAVKDAITLSSGTRLGVKVENPSVGYCILAANDGGTYDSGASATSITYSKMLFFDSATGKLTEYSKLTSSGACAYFMGGSF